MNSRVWKQVAIISCIIPLMTSCALDGDVENNSEDFLLTRQLEAVSPTGSLDYFVLPESNDLNRIPQDINNPLSPQKVALGKLLFHETGLGVNPKEDSNMSAFSCASCHHARAGFQAGAVQGMGDGGVGFGLSGEAREMNPDYAEEDIDVQQVRSPSTLNSAYQVNQLWNGQFGATGLNIGTEAQWTEETPKETNHLGFEGVETQAIAGLGVHRMDMTEELVTELGYKSQYDEVFADIAVEDRYSIITTGLAIAAYERTLLANKSPFQLWLRGQRELMTSQEKEGAYLFFGKANCSSCHTGPALNEMQFYGYGFKDLSDNDLNIVMRNSEAIENLGRGGFTGNAAENMKFKVPQLYNLLNSPHYGHGGTFHTIKEVVDYKNQGVKENPNVPDEQLAEEFKPLGLSESEVEAISAFISSGLYDADLMRYEPSVLPSGNCFPNADPQSQADLGCD